VEGEAVTEIETLYRILAAIARGRSERALDALAAARTDEEFAAAWQRWYFDDEEWTR
jgi:hypothetical protein